jgi:hypothetical protein
MSLSGSMGVEVLRPLLLSAPNPRGSYDTRFDLVVDEALGGYPSLVQSMSFSDSNSFLTMICFITVPDTPSALAMLAMGTSTVSNAYMQRQVALEVGAIGVTVDLVQPPPSVAVGTWFVEVLGERHITLASSSSPPALGGVWGWCLRALCLVLVVSLVA